MKKLLSKITFIAASLLISASINAQTSGTLTFTFTEVAKEHLLLITVMRSMI